MFSGFSICTGPLLPINNDGSLNPLYQVPCYTSHQKTPLDIYIYEEKKSDVIEYIPGMEVSITTDLDIRWGKRNVTLTTHLISNDWQYKTIVLATHPVDKKHTGANIAETLTAIQAEFKIRKLVALVQGYHTRVLNSGYSGA